MSSVSEQILINNTALPSLPPGWLWVSLEEIASHKSGIAFKSNDFISNGVQVIRLGNVYKGQLDLSREPVYLPEQLLSDNFVLKPGDIVVSQTGTRSKRDYGNFVIIPDDAPKLLLNQRLLAIFCLPPISPKYIFYASKLNIYQEHFFSHETGGVNQGNVGVAGVMKGPIPFPPLNEQCRIVAKIEALKARSQRVKEELEAIPALLDQFRQSVLAAAFRGDLTADWREKNPDVEPASALLERIHAERRRRWEEAELEKMRSKGQEPLTDIWKAKYEAPEVLDSTNFSELPSVWCWARVQDIGLVQLGRQRSPQNHTGEYMRKYLRAANITWNGLGLSDVKEMNFNPEDFKRFRLEYGDILLNEASGSQSEVGKPAIWRDEIPDCCIQNTLIRVRPVIPIFEFLYYHFFWNAISGAFGNASKGIGIHHLGSQILAEWLIRVPPIAEQKEIVFRIRKLLKAAESTKQQYQESKAYLDQLNQSILAKAFRGELVPQDPNDEPASVLLERIRAEREKLDTKKKVKGKTEKKSRKEKVETVEPEQLSLPGFD